jgi:hypothetical protein
MAVAVLELDFAVEGAHAVRHAAAPTLGFSLRVERVGGGRVGGVMLQAQLRIAATRRAYAEGERERLGELFGRPEQWGRSVGSLHWTSVSAVLPPFDDVTVAELPVPVTYDFDVAAARYFHALEDGDVPVELLFSGSAFYEDDGRLQTTLVPWSKEARFALPVAVWREALDAHFPGTAWLRLDRDAFERLRAYRARGGFPTWERALDALLERAP